MSTTHGNDNPIYRRQLSGTLIGHTEADTAQVTFTHDLTAPSAVQIVVNIGGQEAGPWTSYDLLEDLHPLASGGNAPVQLRTVQNGRLIQLRLDGPTGIITLHLEPAAFAGFTAIVRDRIARSTATDPDQIADFAGEIDNFASEHVIHHGNGTLDGEPISIEFVYAHTAAAATLLNVTLILSLKAQTATWEIPLSALEYTGDTYQDSSDPDIATRTAGTEYRIRLKGHIESEGPDNGTDTTGVVVLAGAIRSTFVEKVHTRLHGA